MASKWGLLATGRINIGVKWVGAWLSFIDDLIFPVYCVGCKKEGERLCESCLVKCPPPALNYCPFCNVPTMYGITCENHRYGHKLDGLTTRGSYREWWWQPLIKKWKFGGDKKITQIFLPLLLPSLAQLPHGIYNPLVIPVPLTKRRERARGFNQAYDLANYVANVVEGECVQVVVRQRETKPQPGLSKSARQKNIVAAFKVVESVQNRDCIVVDDLLTTGATMEEMAKVLKLAGAKKVWGVSLCRTMLDV